MSELLESYTQLASGHPVDSYEPGTSKQRIDLTEYYKETQQDTATAMVTGTEEFRSGKLSRATAITLNLPGARGYDPFPSERNARAGQEGFFQSVKEGFKTFIENIIKYIRMAIEWVVNTIKTVLGFRKSERINTAINDKLGEVKTEFEQTMTGLGFPAGQYNVENYIGNLPRDVDRINQVLLMKSKVENDKEAIEGLANALPLIQQCIAKLKASSEKVVTSSKKLKQVIGDEYKRARVRAGRPDLAVATSEAPEVNRLVKACFDVNASLDPDSLATDIGKLYETLYKIKFSNDELLNGFNNVKTQLQQHIQTERVKLGKNNVAEFMRTIQYLNARYVSIAPNEMDLSGINWKAMGGIVDKDDATKVQEIANHFNYPPLLAAYQEASAAVRNFSQFCLSVSQALMVVQQQATNLIDWHGRATMYYMHGVAGDLDKLREVHLKARAEGLSPRADAMGNPEGIVFIPDADAQTFGEKFALQTSMVLDISGFKENFNTLAKQTGWSKPL